MDLNFNKNEDQNKLLLSDLRKRFTKVKQGGGKNKIEKLIYDKLKRKITQFESRGVILQYDLEPFNNEDWTQIHLGMGRIPDRYDPLADKVEETQLIETLKNIKKILWGLSHS